jgi:hypothetical protein
MVNVDAQQINICLRQLYGDNQETRINAINQHGEIGDAPSLKELWEMLKYISKDHQALIIAVGMLKKEREIK